MSGVPRRLKLVVLIALLVVLVAGCSRTAQVSGTVTWEGKEVEQGYITFYPADRKGIAQGAEVIHGRYTVASLAPGKKQVRVVARHRAVLTGSGPSAKVTALPPSDAIPENAAGNNQTVEVSSGSQTLDFALKKAK